MLGKVLDFMARMKLRQARGGSWLTILINMGVISMNIKLFFPNADIVVYVLVGICWLLLTTSMGFIDEFKGIWKREQNYVTKNVNPVFGRIDENVKKLIEMEKKKK